MRRTLLALLGAAVALAAVYVHMMMQPSRWPDGIPPETEPCWACDGTGVIDARGSACIVCDGTGRTYRDPEETP